MRLKLKDLKDVHGVPTCLESYFGKVWDFDVNKGMPYHQYTLYTLPGKGIGDKWWFREEWIDKCASMEYDDLYKLIEEPF